MAILFKSLAVLFMLAGGGWAVLAMGAAARTQTTMSAMGLLAGIVVASPGLSVLGVGLLFLAIGGVLARLAQLVAYYER
ncbi:MAG: hypothetical protein HY834_09075 [Devosia nanyangense]|uniref:Uncharacterized protein n=1 Tax=Devosia nanyangense TaxID=1228055 RepID=A0A933L316_9HYPH|nr:hypothetical protein [Devosia nanyangense]